MKNKTLTKIVFLLIFVSFQQIIFCNNNDDFEINEIDQLFNELIKNDIASADSLSDSLIEEKAGNNKYGVCIGYYYKGEIAYKRSEWSNAADYYQKSLDCLQDFDDKKKIANAYNNLGCVYLYLSLYNKALEALTKSLEYELTIANPVGIAQSYQNIALVYDRQKNFKKAIEYNLIACDYLADTEFEDELAGVYNNLATLYSGESKFKDAENFYIKAIDIYDKNKISDKKAKVMSNYGNLKVKQGKYDEGGEILERALALFRNNSDIFSEVAVYEMLADMYALKNEYDQALFLSEMAYQKSQETDSYYLQLSALYSLYLFYRKTENWKDALEKYEIYTNIKDSLIAFDISAYADVLQIELKKTLQDTELLNKYVKESKTKFYTTIIIFITIFIAAILIFSIYVRKIKVELNFMRTEQNLLKKRTKFSLQSFLPKQNVEKDKIIEYLPILTEVLEKTIDSTENIFVTVKSEIEYICTFIALCKNLYNKEIKLRLETNIPDSKVNSVIVPVMLFKNSIDHFLFCPENQSKELFFNVAFMINDNLLEVTIEDNASQTFYKKHDKDGKILDSEILLIKKRMKMMNKRGKNFIFKGINIEDNKTRFCFTFPLVYC